MAFGGYGGGGFGGGNIDPQVAMWFQSVDQDRSGHISAIELQQALTNNNWSHFSINVCQVMIGMFDHDRSGTISLPEFQALWNYIQQWRGIFEQFDRDRSGQIEAVELSNAFQQMGYNLSPAFSQLIVSRYDQQNRRAVTLDTFIAACITLKSLTDSFRQKDTTQQGVIRMGYEEFMAIAMINIS